MKIEIVPACPAHLKELQERLRENDRLEIERAGSTVPAALMQSWRESLMTKAALVDGAVAGVWGVGGSPLSGVGQPWLLTTPVFARAGIAMVKCGIRESRDWLRIFDRLESYVDATYGQACRYLETIGFALDAPRALPNGAKFRRFWMER